MDAAERAYDFSVRIAELVRYLKADGKEYPLSDKLLDCGVDAGLAARAGDRARAAEHVRQADFILDMAARAGYLTDLQTRPMRGEIAELLRLLQGPEAPGQARPV